MADFKSRQQAELNGLARQRIGAGNHGLARDPVAAVARPTIGISAQSGNIRKNGFSIARDQRHQRALPQIV